MKTVIGRQVPQYSIEELEVLVNPVFTRKIQEAIDSEPIQKVLGAKEFVSYLLRSNEYIVSIATGRWRETAKLKLESAGFDTTKLIIASSNDHFSRMNIMEVARLQVDSDKVLPITHFGDVLWDIKACDKLGG